MVAKCCLSIWVAEPGTACAVKAPKLGQAAYAAQGTLP